MLEIKLRRNGFSVGLTNGLWPSDGAWRFTYPMYCIILTRELGKGRRYAATTYRIVSVNILLSSFGSLKCPDVRIMTELRPAVWCKANAGVRLMKVQVPLKLFCLSTHRISVNRRFENKYRLVFFLLLFSLSENKSNGPK